MSVDAEPTALSWVQYISDSWPGGALLLGLKDGTFAVANPTDFLPHSAAAPGFACFVHLNEIVVAVSGMGTNVAAATPSALHLYHLSVHPSGQAALHLRHVINIEEGMVSAVQYVSPHCLVAVAGKDLVAIDPDCGERVSVKSFDSDVVLSASIISVRPRCTYL